MNIFVIYDSIRYSLVLKHYGEQPFFFIKENVIFRL